MKLSPLNQRRWRNFKANRRAYWSLILFSLLYILSLGAELIANDKPLLMKYRGEYYAPIFRFYAEREFGGIAGTQALYAQKDVQCLILSGGLEDCLYEEPEEMLAEIAEKGSVLGTPVTEPGWMIWPPIPYSYTTAVETGGPVPSPPTAQNLLGTDEASRDVLALVIYGFRLSVTFALIVTALNAVFGVIAGAVQGYFGGRIDLIFQRLIELWSSVPSLYVIIIVTAALGKGFWLMVAMMVLFGWTGLVGVVRAEFLRARNFEYVRAAKALGVSDWQIMRRHMLPNAMVATLTMMPFLVTGTIAGLASLDYLGFGLPSSAPSLGALTRQAQGNLHQPHLAWVAFGVFALMLSLLVFIFEGVRDAFDPRKTFK